MTGVPSPQDIARAFTVPVNGYTPLEGREVVLNGDVVTIWEANTYAHKPGEVHLELGRSGETLDVVLKVRSVREHSTTGQEERPWRVGNCQPQNLYEGDRFTGALLAGSTSKRVADALNGGPAVTYGVWTRDGRHLFEGGVDVGSEFTEEDAARVVAVMNGAAS